jgi:hypothetical protein
MNALVQFILFVVLFAIAGLIVGIGVQLVNDFPKVGAFLKQRPILGWTLAFTAGGTIYMLLIALFDFVVLMLLSQLMR